MYPLRSSLQESSIIFINNGIVHVNIGATLPCGINTDQQLTLQVNYREARQLFKKRRPVELPATTTVLKDLYSQQQKSNLSANYSSSKGFKGTRPEAILLSLRTTNLTSITSNKSLYDFTENGQKLYY